MEEAARDLLETKKESSDEEEPNLEDVKKIISKKQMKLFQKYLDDHLKMNPSTDEIMDNGFLKFDLFMKVYKIALSWNKILFKTRKTEFVKQRRELIQNDKEADYARLCNM